MSPTRRGIPLAAALAVVAAAAIAVAVLRYSGALQLNRPSPDRYPVMGLDVSHHQGAIDWPVLAASGQSFVFIKATEGGDWVDPQFEANFAGARAAGLAAGPYHFFTFCTPGLAQAEHFLEVAPPRAAALALAPVIDVEFVGNCKSWSDLAKVRAELAAFMTRVEAAWATKPILYVTRDSLDRVIADGFAGHPIWIRDVISEPAPEDHRGWLLWQFSDNSRLPGIDGPVDRNALRPGATLEDLRPH